MPLFAKFIFLSLAISQISSARNALSPEQTILQHPDGTVNGVPVNMAAVAANAATAASTASAAAQGGATAAQAVSAAAQAGMMYRLLLAQGVMDYFHRKQLDKANQKMAEKMEQLQRELKSGKLNQAQYAAIKAAVEEAYQKNSKSEVPQDKTPNADSSQSKADSNLDFNQRERQSLRVDAVENNLEAKENKLLPKDLVQLTNQNLKSSTESSEQNAKKGSENMLEKSSSVPGSAAPSGTLGGGLFPMNIAHQQDGFGFVSPWGAVQEKVTEKTIYKDSKSETDQNSDHSPVDLFLEPEERSSLDSWEAPSDGSHGRDLASKGNLVQAESRPRYWLSEVSGGLKRVLKPVKFQKNLFSLKPYSEEEGVHLGFLLLGIIGAYVWGKKKASLKNKIPHVIPEVILTPRSPRTVGGRDRRYLKRI